jgi:hypothetical protein
VFIKFFVDISSDNIESSGDDEESNSAIRRTGKSGLKTLN